MLFKLIFKSQIYSDKISEYGPSSSTTTSILLLVASNMCTSHLSLPQVQQTFDTTLWLE